VWCSDAETAMERGWLEALNRRIVGCERCPRLRAWCREVAGRRRRAFADWEYWGRPVPNFGDPQAALLVVGLAPAAHGANRTGRMFTGDESGNWLYRALFEAGLSSQPVAIRRDDGLQLRGTLITAAVHCAPPQNRPLPQELDNCREWLRALLTSGPPWRAAVTLGGTAFRETVKALRECGGDPGIPLSAFRHGAEYPLTGGRSLLCSYHPSQRNTFTGLVTRGMLRDVFDRARAMAGL
jgi:uracil-DNA glycosylase family 4